MTWWLWVLLGFFLLIVELLTPGGFYIFFFGVGAIIVGALDSLGWAGPDWTQWLLFSLLSVGCLLIFRRPLLRKLKPSKTDTPVDSLVGETAHAMEDIAAGGQGKAELRGAEQYITQFGNLAKTSNTLVLPATLSDVGSMIALAMNVIEQGTHPGTSTTN